MSYRAILEPRARKQLDALDDRLATRIVARLERLAADPRGAPRSRIEGRWLFRLRVGDYRVLYDVRDDLLVVVILYIVHRREAYRRTWAV